MLSEDPEPRAEASVDDALDVRDLTAGFGFYISVLTVEMFDFVMDI